MTSVGNCCGLLSSKQGKKEIVILKNSLEEGQKVIKIIEGMYKALMHAVNIQIMADDEQENAQQYEHKDSKLEGRFEIPFESFQVNLSRFIKRVQTWNKTWNKLRQQMVKRFSPDSGMMAKDLKNEKQRPIQQLNEDCETSNSDANEGRKIPQSHSSSRKEGGRMQNRQDLVTSVMKNLNEMLCSQLSTSDIDLKMQICKSVQEINDDLPLIVISLQSSRLGTDVRNAIRGIKPGPNVAVLVLHYKDIHALPSTKSEKILTGQEFQRLGAIVDMGFLSHKGFYPCDLNNIALDVLTSFITGRSCMY